MSFLRIQTKRGRGYLYRQTNVREGKKVRSIMEYIGALGGHHTSSGRSVPNRNADLVATTNPKRTGYDEEHMRHLFKTDRDAFERLHSIKTGRQQEARERKEAWKEKQLSPMEKEARAEAKQAVEAKHAETAEAVKDFNSAREGEKDAGEEP